MCLEVRNSQDVWLTVLRFIAKTVDPASKAVAALASAQARLQHADMRWATDPVTCGGEGLSPINMLCTQIQVDPGHPQWSFPACLNCVVCSKHSERDS